MQDFSGPADGGRYGRRAPTTRCLAASLVGTVRGVSYFVGVASAVRCHVHVYAFLVCSPSGSS